MKDNNTYTDFVACLDNAWIINGKVKSGYQIKRFNTPIPMTIEGATSEWLRHDISSQIIFVVPAQKWVGQIDQVSMSLLPHRV